MIAFGMFDRKAYILVHVEGDNVLECKLSGLYEAGEFGSIFYHYYSGGGNICECFTSGMMAGQNVSALQAWA